MLFGDAGDVGLVTQMIEGVQTLPGILLVFGGALLKPLLDKAFAKLSSLFSKPPADLPPWLVPLIPMAGKLGELLAKWLDDRLKFEAQARAEALKKE